MGESDKTCRHFIPAKNRHCKLKASDGCMFCVRHIKEQPPRHVLDRPDECPVCMESSDTIPHPFPCGHWVHAECIVMSGKPQCPVCRSKVPLCARDRRECNQYRKRYAHRRYNEPPPPPSSLDMMVLHAQIRAILHAYPNHVQSFIDDVGIDNIIDTRLYRADPSRFHDRLVAHLDASIV